MGSREPTGACDQCRYWCRNARGGPGDRLHARASPRERSQTIRIELRFRNGTGRMAIMKRMLLSAAPALALAGAGPALAQTPKQGGAAIVAFNNELSTLDPQIGYDWQNWSVIKSLFDGLMDYKPGTPELEPDLAESYSISDDGQTYTFKLRDGIKFHNGRPLTAADIKYSIERAVNPVTQGPGGGFFGYIKGYDAMVGDAKATELSGITTPDDRT